MSVVAQNSTAESSDHSGNASMSSVAETFEEAAKKNNIPFQTIEGIKGAEDGFYAVVASLNQTKKLPKFLKKLKRKGFDASSLYNSENGLTYVYIEKYTNGLNAVKACVNEFEGKYTDDVWLLNAVNSFPDIASDAKDKAASMTETAAKTKESKNKGYALKKADTYFDKMWYAEAASLYEQVLKKGDKNYSYDIIQKTADSYYFNSNMEKAYKWYTVLYEKYGKEMSADNIFKYAHSLKGTGKYARSKKLMRLYQKKTEGVEMSELEEDKELPNEIVLDEILSYKRELDIKNLSINTAYSDFSPMYLDSTQIVYASAKDSSALKNKRYKWNNQPYLDLYQAKIDTVAKDLKSPKKLSKNINTKYHEASVAFTPDNKTMFFTRNNYGKTLTRDINGVNNLKLYVSKKVGNDWSVAKELPFNSDNYSTGHPALSPDGKQLYFVSDRPGSLGETDIFVVDILENNTYSEPRNLGPEINTERREMFPFITDTKLYFSSDGHTGLGGLDVYEVPYTKEDGFEEVKNLGQPINSNRDDFSYIVNEEKEEGYFASNRNGGKGDDDIYAFSKTPPPIINAIAGIVIQLSTGDSMPQEMVELLDENGIKLKEMLSDEEGSFLFKDLDPDTKYSVRVNKIGYFESIQNVTSIENDTLNILVPMKKLDEMIAVENGIKKIKTKPIYFDFDKWDIREKATVELDKLIEIMKKYPKMVIKIESHTDSRGNNAYNKHLSNERAKSTRDYIVSQGIAAERIESAIGYGEERLLNGCDGSIRCSAEQHFKNRRSEFIILNM